MMSEMWSLDPRTNRLSLLSGSTKSKHGADRSAEKFKAHFVARGFAQKEGVDYDEIFAPVALYTTICSIIALAASQGWNLY